MQSTSYFCMQLPHRFQMTRAVLDQSGKSPTSTAAREPHLWTPVHGCNTNEGRGKTSMRIRAVNARGRGSEMGATALVSDACIFLEGY